MPCSLEPLPLAENFGNQTHKQKGGCFRIPLFSCIKHSLVEQLEHSVRQLVGLGQNSGRSLLQGLLLGHF